MCCLWIMIIFFIQRYHRIGPQFVMWGPWGVVVVNLGHSSDGDMTVEVMFNLCFFFPRRKLPRYI